MKKCPQCGQSLAGKRPWLVTRHIQQEYMVNAESRIEAIEIAADDSLPHQTRLMRVSCVSAIWENKHQLTTDNNAKGDK